MPNHSHDLETRVQALGATILDAARRSESARSVGERWIGDLLEKSMENERLRVQALRFVDVLPSLGDDTELVRHLKEYFTQGELPLPGIAQWGLARAGALPGQALLAKAVRKAMASMAQRFLGGHDADAVLGTVARLRRQGLDCSLDRLGEAVVSEAEADAYRDAYLGLIQRMGDRAAGLNLSVKLSSLYSLSTPRDPEGSIGGILFRLRPLLEEARRHGISVCLDMEQYDLKDLVLEVFQRVAMEPGLRDWPGLGVALQTYLREADADLAALVDWVQARDAPITVRLVRGAYWDQETVLAAQHGWPSPVWADKRETDACFERCLGQLFDAQPRIQPAVASHNVRSLALAMAHAEARGNGPEGFEFQMLYGMGQGLHEAVAAMGYRLRVYVPFGELLPGMAYLVRRLLENSSSQSFLSMGRVPSGDVRQLLQPPQLSAPGPEPVAPAHEEQLFANEPVRRFTGAAEREGFAEALGRVRTEFGHTYPLVIGGREQMTAHRIVSVNPARPQEPVGEVAVAGEAEAEAAVAAALEALPAWRDSGAEARAALLLQAAERLRERRDEFSAWQIYEAGKSWPEADADVCEAIDFLEYYAREARRMARGRSMDAPGETNAYCYEPRGVAVIIPPWNFPLAILTGMLAAAVVTGNTAILKPSSQTPVVAARFVALLREAGVPDGVVNFLPGEGRSLGEYLVRHPQVHLIAFTGSVAVGTRINRLAAEIQPGQHHVKRVIAEMGGKNAIIIDTSADLDAAVSGTLASAFGLQGQKCSACSRVIVVGSAYQGLLPRLLDAAACLPVGMPEEPGTVMGPIIEAAARDRIRRAITQGKETARLALERDVSALEPGFFVGPTIFTDVAPDSPLAQEEIFGPVLAVMAARDFHEALALANGTRYALTGGLYSRSPASVETARKSFQVGNLYINRKITGALVGRQPFGGFRLSGVGSKAGGPDYLLQFVEPRTVTEDTLRRGYAPSAHLARALERP